MNENFIHEVTLFASTQTRYINDEVCPVGHVLMRDIYAQHPELRDDKDLLHGLIASSR